jgi:hypothetical protein
MHTMMLCETVADVELRRPVVPGLKNTGTFFARWRALKAARRDDDR